MGVKVEKPLSKNMELVAYHDLNGQPGFQMALQVVDGRYYLYVTTYYHQGWQILDVTDMDHICCKHLDDPRGKSGTVHPKIQIADGIMITASGQRVRFLPMEGVDYDDYDAGIEIWDVKTDPMNPKLLGFWSNGGGVGIDGYDQTLSQITCLCKIGDVATMKNIEDAVGHDDGAG